MCFVVVDYQLNANELREVKQRTQGTLERDHLCLEIRYIDELKYLVGVSCLFSDLG